MRRIEHVANVCNIWVPGIPRTKGSVQIMPKAGCSPLFVKGSPYYRIKDLWTAPRRSERAGKKVDLLAPWVAAIQWAALEHKPTVALDGPFHCSVTFYFDRPRQPRDDEWRVEEPDADKLIRAVGDALQSVFWQNDSQIVRWVVEKRHAGPEGPGMSLTIEYRGRQQVLL
jgi:Holliday junction resolvase RusA-like endonuclease